MKLLVTLTFWMQLSQRNKEFKKSEAVCMANLNEHIPTNSSLANVHGGQVILD